MKAERVARRSRSSSRWTGSRTIVIDVAPKDKVSDMTTRIPSVCDMYVTRSRRVLGRSDKLRSFGVYDGSTVQVMSRVRRRKTQG